MSAAKLLIFQESNCFLDFWCLWVEAWQGCLWLTRCWGCMTGIWFDSVSGSKSIRAVCSVSLSIASPGMSESLQFLFLIIFFYALPRQWALSWCHFCWLPKYSNISCTSIRLAVWLIILCIARHFSVGGKPLTIINSFGLSKIIGSKYKYRVKNIHATHLIFG